MVQPAAFAGTNRYKVGCSDKSDTSRVTLGYHKGTTLRIAEMVQDPFEVEKAIIKLFATRFHCFLGREYFEGDVVLMERCFKEVTAQFKDAQMQQQQLLVDAPEQKSRFRCGKCNKELTSKRNLKNHENKCKGLLPNQCGICFKVFASSQSKYNHTHYVKCYPPETAILA